ncbi:MAG: bifunctional hydroxymethylpyrimidine kinase/phosphomethylpyrimidine kinase [Chloroherpetonaceae bacterium]|nr:bifunctional hydroxymethylpyrimidine kinase/phosphomethylpyrimidine kinase [Chloroherpetonaceae bacterium]
MNTYIRLLTVAGSDSGGGAGIQADLKTFSALGCYGMSAITALTAQNTVGVEAIYGVPAEFVAKQINAVVQDIGVNAVKIGMLATADIIKAVADRLAAHQLRPVVLDPVMTAKSGDRLLEESAVEALRTCLLPLATVVTPNLPETSLLLGRTVRTRSEMEQAARDLQALGAKNVLVKGGHLSEPVSADCLLTEEGSLHWLEAKRIHTANTHGTGCTLSSAIAAYLAKGVGIVEAVKLAKNYLTGAIERGATYALGKGHAPVHHFYQLWTN